MKCIVVTPEKTLLEKEASFVVIPFYDGEYGIAPKHTPVIGRVGAGELRISSSDEGDVDRWFIQGGFAEVLNDTVTILTHRAKKVGELNSSDARANLERAMKRRVLKAELQKEKERDVNFARSEVRLAEKNRSR